MCKELGEELKRGTDAMYALAHHLKAMGAARMAMPVKIGDELYYVAIANVPVGTSLEKVQQALFTLLASFDGSDKPSLPVAEGRVVSFDAQRIERAVSEELNRNYDTPMRPAPDKEDKHD